jgi:ribonuclease HI
MRFYVVFSPPKARGVYTSWPECEARVRGVPGASYRAVESREEAEALLRGEAATIPAGVVHVFTDGNHLGGCGLVFFLRREDGREPIVREMSFTVEEAASMLHLDIPVSRELARLRNVLAELMALGVALDHLRPGTSLVVVHDYEGVGAWMAGRWKTKDPTVSLLVRSLQEMVARKHLILVLRHQRGHQSPLGGDEFALYNSRADRLAADAGRRRPL